MSSILTTYQTSFGELNVWKNEECQLHREDGPAIERAGGDNIWYQFDKLHREDGPAIERADGTQHWFMHGREMDPLEIFLIKSKKKVDVCL